MSWSTVLADFQATLASAQAQGSMPLTIAAAQQGIVDVQPLIGPTIAPTLVNLAANTAIDLGPIFPTVTLPRGENQSEVALLYGNAGCAYDSKRLQIVIFPGGHAGTNYNSILVQRLTDLKLVELYPPTNTQPDMTWANYDTPPTLVGNGLLPNKGRGCWLADLSGGGGIYPRPAARHTGDQLRVLGDDLHLFDNVEGNGANTQQYLNMGSPAGVDPLHLFSCRAQVAHFNFVTGTWSWDTANPPDSDGDGGTPQWGAVELDPPSNLFWWINQAGFYTYDPTAPPSSRKRQIFGNNWSGHLVDENGATVPNTIAICGTHLYRPVDQKHYFVSRGINGEATPWQVWRLDADRTNLAAAKLVRLTVTGQTPMQGTPSSWTTSGEQPIRYDTANDVFGSGPWSNQFYVFDPKTKAWSHQTINGNAGNVATLSHMLAYSPEANVYWFMTDQDNVPSRSHTWAYRYK